MRRADAQGALFSTVRTEGNLLPADILAKIVSADTQIPGLLPTDYHLPKGEKLNEAINRSWSRLRTFWEKFNQQRALLREPETGTSLTREGLLLPLFSELGYGRLLLAKAEDRTIGDKVFSISHFWNHSPLHLLGCNIDLDRKAKGVQGASQASPHSTVQDFLNRSDAHMWGFCSNGLRLRILRDNVSFSRQAFIEFDLESMFEGEVFSDFVLLWLLCHQSRVESDQQANCWLEQWARSAQEQSVRALDTLRDSVQKAIEILGQGFLESHNPALKESLRGNELSRQDYFRQLLRLVYRLLFLFAAEDRNLLHAPHTPESAKERYAKWHSTARLRRLAGSMTGTNHHDMFEGLKCVMAYLGREQGCPELGVSPLGSFLWSADAMPHISEAQLSNHHLLSALRTLAYTQTQGLRRPVDYKNVGARELGSIYESLLELHPTLDSSSGYFKLETASGHERKTTGSYYTPTSLIENLLDSALEPVITQAIMHGGAEGNAELALLSLKICDPACGSGHFLIAAAHRLAKRLAGVRTGDEEPGPDAMRTALRDVIGRCIYGVDINPMAVELCKVSLWLEALEPGKPLSFLDHHIRCGNSLMGATPDLISGGLPDDTFKAISGDEKEACKALKKINTSVKKEKSMPLLAQQQRLTQAILRDAAAVDVLPSDSLSDIKSKETAFLSLQQTKEFQDKRVLADMWCAAFVMRKYFPPKEGHPTLPADTPFGITQRHINTFALGQDVQVNLLEEAGRVATQYQFFHWHLAFPEVFVRGGFDVMLGNPPWDKIQPEEEKFFAVLRPDIAQASSATKRKQLISQLATDDPLVNELWLAYKRKIDATCHFISSSNYFKHTGCGNLNTYRCFAELSINKINNKGMAGVIVQTGIATDETSKDFFAFLVNENKIQKFIDIENREKIFEIDSRMRFCLLTICNNDKTYKNSTYAWMLKRIAELNDKERFVQMDNTDIKIFNPDSSTAPILLSNNELYLGKHIYKNTTYIAAQSIDAGKDIDFLGEFFNMTRDLRFFKDVYENTDYPLYEAKFIHQFDHRFSSVENGTVTDVEICTKIDPTFSVTPKKYVDFTIAKEKAEQRNFFSTWLCGFRSVASPTNERTAIATIFPFSAVGNSINLILKLNPIQALTLVANVNSFVFDYCARQKISGANVNIWIFKQLPIVGQDALDKRFIACQSERNSSRKWITNRAFELTYTATDMEPFARDCGYSGPPFRWDEERRFHLRAELDATFFHLYLPANADGTWQKAEKESDTEFQALCSAFPTPRHAVDYIMETFPIVKRKDEAAHGEYRTKRVILEIYDAMQEAMRTGIAYETRLTPPPVELELPSLQKEREAPADAVVPAYTPSAAQFPYGAREKQVNFCITALMRDYPGKAFDDLFDAMLLATCPKECAAILPAHQREGFMQALAATGLTWEFAATDKVRYHMLKKHLNLMNVQIIKPDGLCRLPDNFDFRDAPSMTTVGKYFFEALGIIRQREQSLTIQDWVNTRANIVDMGAEAAA